MGALANNICFETVALATDAYFSFLQPVLVKGGGSSDFYHFYSNVAGVWYLDEYSVTGGGVFTLQHHGVLPVPSFAICTFVPIPTSTENFNDGIQMGWGVVLAMALAASIIFIRRAFFR